jgi:uncharacterized tellurite resistance protein B-like protein
MASEKTEQLSQLKSVVHAKGGHHVFAAAKSALAARGKEAPLASNGDDDEQAGRHALATFDAAFLMAASDGVVSDDEIDELSEILSMMTDGSASDDDLGYLLDNFAEALQQEGLDERLANIADALDTEDARRLAFVTACGIAYLDGQVTEEEEALFATLAKALRIPAEEANGLLEEIEKALEIEA